MRNRWSMQNAKGKIKWSAINGQWSVLVGERGSLWFEWLKDKSLIAYAEVAQITTKIAKRLPEPDEGEMDPFSLNLRFSQLPRKGSLRVPKSIAYLTAIIPRHFPNKTSSVWEARSLHLSGEALCRSPFAPSFPDCALRIFHWPLTADYCSFSEPFLALRAKALTEYIF